MGVTSSKPPNPALITVPDCHWHRMIATRAAAGLRPAAATGAAEMAEAGFGARRSYDPGAARVRYTLSARDVLM